MLGRTRNTGVTNTSQTQQHWGLTQITHSFVLEQLSHSSSVCLLLALLANLVQGYVGLGAKLLVSTSSVLQVLQLWVVVVVVMVIVAFVLTICVDSCALRFIEMEVTCFE